MPRFFVSTSQINNGIISILDDDAHHISFSLRMRLGEKITVCDSDSREYQCEIVKFSQDLVEAKILNESQSLSEPPYKVVVYQALVKGDKFDTVIQKSIETGAYKVVPFISSRCIVKLDEKAIDSKLDRWNKIALEASKQCGRGIKCEVGKCLSYKDMINEAIKADLPIICYENEDKTTLKEIFKVSSNVKTISIIIGPEGGISKEEIDIAISSGVKCCSLGKRILRTETAAQFALSCASYEYEM